MNMANPTHILDKGWSHWDVWDPQMTVSEFMATDSFERLYNIYFDVINSYIDLFTSEVDKLELIVKEDINNLMDELKSYEEKQKLSSKFVE